MEGVGEEIVDSLTKKLEEFAGPMARFVISKKLRDMGETKDTITAKKLPFLVEQSVNTSVYHPRMKARVMREMFALLSDLVEPHDQVPSGKVKSGEGAELFYS